MNSTKLIRRLADLGFIGDFVNILQFIKIVDFLDMLIIANIGAVDQSWN